MLMVLNTKVALWKCPCERLGNNDYTDAHSGTPLIVFTDVRSMCHPGHCSPYVCVLSHEGRIVWVHESHLLGARP